MAIAVTTQRRAKRGHGEGSFYKAADGLRAALTVRLPDGSSKRVYLRGKTKRELQQKADEARRRVERGQTPSATSTTAEYLQRWLEDGAAATIRASSLELYTRHVGYVVSEVGRVRLSALTPAHIQRCYTNLLRSRAPSTVRVTHAVFHRALRQAVRWKILTSNPADYVDLPYMGRTERRTLTVAEVSRLMDAAAAAEDRLTALWGLLATTGLRRGEACGLRWRDLDLDRNSVNVRVQLVRQGRGLVLTEPKTQRSLRTVRLSAHAVELLRVHRVRQDEERRVAGLGWNEWQGAELVFTRPDGLPLSPPNLRNPLNRALRRAGLPHVRVHDLRHTAATILLQSGIPVPTVSAMLGHESAALTYRVYAHVIPDDQQRAADLFDAVLGKLAV